jgi:hypothetical protein
MLNGAAGALKTDWAKPFHDARPMGIEWLAELWTRGIGLWMMALQLSCGDMALPTG